MNFYVYILTNFNRSVLYTGITNDLIRRVHEHKSQELQGFSKRYKVNQLVYYEIFHTPTDAITREKQLKAGSRRKKVALIEGFNPTWQDLYADIAS